MGLKEQGLLEIIEPERAVDKITTEKLATAMTEIITSGVLDELAKEETAFHELSMSRLGWYGDEGLYNMIFEELKERGLAKESEDEVSIPMHPKVRSLVLVLLSQILRPYGSTINATLSPATDMGSMVGALSELLSLMSLKVEPSLGSVVEFDLNTVTVDLAAVPFNEVLDFRKQNLDAHKHYMLSVRKFAMELSRMPEEEQEVALELRQTQLNDLAKCKGKSSPLVDSRPGECKMNRKALSEISVHAAEQASTAASETATKSGPRTVDSRRWHRIQEVVWCAR